MPSFALAVRPDPLSFGTLHPGVSAKGTLTLRNKGAEPIAVERIETSYPCIKLSPIPLRIEPNRTANLTVGYDASEDPTFRGGLGVDIAGLGKNSEVLFRTVVKLNVADRSPETEAPR